MEEEIRNLKGEIEAIKHKLSRIETCKDCAHRWTTNCALYYATYFDENGAKVYFNDACHNDDFYCAYGVKKPE